MANRPPSGGAAADPGGVEGDALAVLAEGLLERGERGARADLDGHVARVVG